MSPRGVMTMLILAAVFRPLAASALPEGRAREDSKVDRPWGRESEGFRSRIWLDKAPSGVDAAVKVHYEIQNASKKEKTVWHSGFWPNHRIDVKGSDGELASMTEKGESVRKAFDPTGRRRKHVPWKLAAGASDDSWEVYDVGDLFLMTAPGTYTIQYVYQQGRMKPVESNVLKVVIPGP